MKILSFFCQCGSKIVMKMAVCLFLLLVLAYFVHHLRVVLFLSLHVTVFVVVLIFQFFLFIRIDKNLDNHYDCNDLGSFSLMDSLSYSEKNNDSKKKL